VILACLAKFPEERPQSAAELASQLTAAVPGDGWTAEHAQRWWDRHHPEAAPPEHTGEPKQMLTKTMEAMWEPVETPADELDTASSR
jgi:hypothetical protein